MTAYCQTTTGRDFIGLNVNDKDNDNTSTPLEFFEIFKKQYAPVGKYINPDTGEEEDCSIENLLFQEIAEKTSINFS